jgi:hypothetical protein
MRRCPDPRDRLLGDREETSSGRSDPYDLGWAGGAGKRGTGAAVFREFASKAALVSRSVGTNQAVRLGAEGSRVTGGTAAPCHRVLVTRSRQRPRVLRTISISVRSIAAGVASRSAWAATFRRRPWLHHHQPRRAATGAAASSRVANPARANCRGAGSASSATKGRLGAFFKLL